MSLSQVSRITLKKRFSIGAMDSQLVSDSEEQFKDKHRTRFLTIIERSLGQEY